MKLYDNFINDGTLTNFYGGKTDSGYKLQINNSKMTAVEWLEEEIKDLIPNDIGSQLKFKNKFKKAKAMEKEQSLKVPSYDLDELAEDMLKSHKDFNAEGFSDYHNGRLNGIYEGFQKALELLTFKSE